MCGGESQPFDSIKPFMDVYGKNVKLMGGSGMGQHTKMAN
jgi:3-hydroxyisobutyrate dehydrogenase